VAGIWYAKARFTHASHTTMQCTDCHDAATSKASTDLLIPGVENCRQCHAGEAATDKVPTTCIGCHGYHDSDHLILAELQQRAKAEATTAGGAR
jgi:predicted CXXCH cytochrome family protein